MEKPQAKAIPKTKDGINERVWNKSKPPTKGNKKPHDFKLHTEERAIKRAMFNYSVATKLFVIQLHKKQQQDFQKMIEEEEIRLMRKEMIPKAQLMPYFDKPFTPQRSNRPLTVPKEPSFHMMSNKCWDCISKNELHNFQDNMQALRPIR